MVDDEVETIEVELLAEVIDPVADELLADVETDPPAEELVDATSLAPQIAGALTAAPKLLFI